jgi:autotransporter-associated beta strand protein
MNGGELQFGTGNTLANALSLNVAVSTIDTQSYASTLSGTIAGTGALTKLGPGTLTLAGANTYAGGTNLNAGTLNIANNTALGSGTLSINAGALQFGASSLILSNGILLNGAANTFDTQNYNSTLSGVIGGSGGLTKIGSGMLTLTGANTYGGPTAVNAGTLQLGANNAMPTATALTVASGAIFDMQTYRQVLASYSGAGTLKTTVPATGAPNLTISGNANFAGGTLNVAFAPQVITSGEHFTTIAYGSLTPNATFATILTPAAYTFTSAYDPTSLVLIVASKVSYAQSAATPNQLAIANLLDSLRSGATGDLAAVMGNLDTLSAPQLQAAFDSISPISLAAMSGLGMANSSVQAASVGQRIAALANGSTHDEITSYTVNARSLEPGDLLASAGMEDMIFADENSPKSLSAQNLGSASSPWGFYTSGVGTMGSLQSINGASGLQPGYAFNTGGLTGGADYRFNDNLVAGVSAGYLHGHASVYSPGNGTVDNNSGRFGVYAAGFKNNFRANMYVGGAWDAFTTSRGVEVGNLYRTATASPKGAELNTDASVSYDIETSRLGTYSPFAGLNYDRLTIGSFSESGADSLDLNVSPETAESLRSSVGFRVSQKFEDGPHTWTPYGSLGWRHEFENQSRPIEAQLASGVGSQFTTSTADIARNGLLAGLGVLVKVSQNTMVKLDYSGDFRSDFNDNEFNASVRFRF